MEVLVVSLAEIAHAIPLEHVREVLRAALPIPLPGAPAAVEGALDVRGTFVPVIDMRRRLGYPERPLCEADHFANGTVPLSAHGLRLITIASSTGGPAALHRILG